MSYQFQRNAPLRICKANKKTAAHVPVYSCPDQAHSCYQTNVSEEYGTACASVPAKRYTPVMHSHPVFAMIVCFHKATICGFRQLHVSLDIGALVQKSTQHSDAVTDQVETRSDIILQHLKQTTKSRVSRTSEETYKFKI